MATFVDEAAKFYGVCNVVSDEIKGRCLESKRSSSVGQIIFEETALVHAKYTDLEEGAELENAAILIDFYGRQNFEGLETVLDDLASFERVSSLDTARSLLQFVALTHSDKRSSFDPITRLKLDLCNQLTAHNLDQCIEEMRHFRKLHPKLFPADVTEEALGALLGKLNTNQMELEEYGGSGLFPLSAILEHSCCPNCSYTTNGPTLSLTCIREVAHGDRLSIDYGNYYYDPLAERQEDLMNTYGFRCACDACLGPDRKRPITCVRCLSGGLSSAAATAVHFPLPGDFQWSPCSKCFTETKAQHIQQCLERESYYIENPPSSLSEVRQAVAEGALGEVHYIFFRALNEISLKLAEDERRDHSNSPESALSVMQELIRVANSPLQVIPPVHYEKVLFYDRLGQLAVVNGDIKLANDAFLRAYGMSCKAVGESAPLTVSIKRLVTKTPKCLAELLEHYAKG